MDFKRTFQVAQCEHHRLLAGVVHHDQAICTLGKPCKIVHGSCPALVNLIFGDIMATGEDTPTYTCDVDVGMHGGDVNKTENQPRAANQRNQGTVLVREQDGLQHEGFAKQRETLRRCIDELCGLEGQLRRGRRCVLLAKRARDTISIELGPRGETLLSIASTRCASASSAQGGSAVLSADSG